WPLKKDKVKALNGLVEEQLAKGNIVPSNSPWNAPVFVMQKPGKKRWRLLHDLHKINDAIEDMGPLQPGLPSPLMLPRSWKIAVIDIKDCFFQIPLHPSDAPRFAFSVPSINRQAPITPWAEEGWNRPLRLPKYVLPQGMKNSPTICQWYFARILSPVRRIAGDAIIIHYMDDILVCAADKNYLEETLSRVVEALEKEGFEIQSSKVQKNAPWLYVGMKIQEQTITPQQIKLIDNPKTLQVYQLCGLINWIPSFIGVTSEDLVPHFNLH
ncbi:POK18 protein, partial [Grantiella picta]|nr:POK18 protein [Grantiella picta]